MAKLILKQVLKRKKLSARQFAKRIGMDYKHVWRLFHQKNPTFKTMVKWAHALGCKVRDLIDE